jgi:hypothetical protein
MPGSIASSASNSKPSNNSQNKTPLTKIISRESSDSTRETTRLSDDENHNQSDLDKRNKSSSSSITSSNNTKEQIRPVIAVRRLGSRSASLKHFNYQKRLLDGKEDEDSFTEVRSLTITTTSSRDDKTLVEYIRGRQPQKPSSWTMRSADGKIAPTSKRSSSVVGKDLVEGRRGWFQRTSKHQIQNLLCSSCPLLVDSKIPEDTPFDSPTSVTDTPLSKGRRHVLSTLLTSVSEQQKASPSNDTNSDDPSMPSLIDYGEMSEASVSAFSGDSSYKPRSDNALAPTFTTEKRSPAKRWSSQEGNRDTSLFPTKPWMHERNSGRQFSKNNIKCVLDNLDDDEEPRVKTSNSLRANRNLERNASKQDLNRGGPSHFRNPREKVPEDSTSTKKSRPVPSRANSFSIGSHISGSPARTTLLRRAESTSKIISDIPPRSSSKTFKGPPSKKSSKKSELSMVDIIGSVNHSASKSNFTSTKLKKATLSTVDMNGSVNNSCSTSIVPITPLSNQSLRSSFNSLTSQPSSNSSLLSQQEEEIKRVLDKQKRSHIFNRSFFSGKHQHAPSFNRLTWTRTREGNFSDWTLMVTTDESSEKTEMYYIHKNIVGLGPRSSQYLLEQFENCDSDDSTSYQNSCSVTLKREEADLIPTLLDHIYTLDGKSLNISTTSATGLRHLADMFGVDTLFKEINDFIQSDMDETNVNIYHREATLFNDEQLLEATAKLRAMDYRSVLCLE